MASRRVNKSESMGAAAQEKIDSIDIPKIRDRPTTDPQETHERGTTEARRTHKGGPREAVKVRFDQGDYAALEALAIQEGTSAAALVRRAVKELIRRGGK